MSDDLPEEYLRVVRMKGNSQVLGPGTRAVIWFHGCSLLCPGCIAKEMNESGAFQPFTPTALAEWVLTQPDIEGVTLSGGDPFDQPLDAMIAFLQEIKSRSGLSVMCYTGRTLEKLLSDHQKLRNVQALSMVDLLVDGPYLEALDHGQLWRGSENQKFHFLSDRYLPEQVNIANGSGREVEFELSVNGTLTLTGLPKQGFLKQFAQNLERHGVNINFLGNTER